MNFHDLKNVFRDPITKDKKFIAIYIITQIVSDERHTHTRRHSYIYIYIYVCVCVCVSASVFMCVYACVFMCLWVCLSSSEYWNKYVGLS